MRFELPAAHKLRNRAVQNKRIEEIDVIRNEKAGFVRIETWFEDGADFRAGKNMMRRQKLRCSQSCFLGSNTMASAIKHGTATAKWSRLTSQSSALRTTNQTRFI